MTSPSQNVMFPSVIILSFNTKGLLVSCVDSVVRESLSWGRPVETIVVDNGSTDGSSAAIREKYQEVVVIENQENLGFARGNNRGIRESSGDPVILLNSDTVLMPGFFSAVEEEYNRGGQVGILAPRLLNADGSLQVSAYHHFPDPLVEIFGYTSIGRIASRLLPWVDYPLKYAMTAEEHEKRREVSHVKGACLIINRKLLDEIDGFDENYFLYREETDLCKRAKDRGWKIIYEPGIFVYHHHKASSQAFSDRGLTHRLRSHYLYLEKHHSWISRVVAYLLFMIYSVVMIVSMTIARALGSRQAASRSSYFKGVLKWHLSNCGRCLR